MTGNNLARSEGNARMAMISMIIGALTNILLDAVFIFVFKMGVTGAAIATVLSAMLSSTILLIYFFISKRSHINIKLHNLKLKVSILREIIVIGSGTFFRQVGVSALATVMNNILGHYGAGLTLKDLSGIKPFIEDTSSLYIAIYGVIAKLTSFLMMPLFGKFKDFTLLLALIMELVIQNVFEKLSNYLLFHLWLLLLLCSSS
jgi:Na+-driven multidrug efflux pump